MIADILSQETAALVPLRQARERKRERKMCEIGPDHDVQQRFHAGVSASKLKGL